MSKDSNFFDDLYSVDIDEIKRQNADQQAKAEKLDYLIHKVFSQNEEGAELLAIWKDSLLMSACADEGMDMVGIGIREGMKRFIRSIIITVNRVEGS